MATIKRGLVLVSTIYETIKDAGPEGAPEGPMYAAMMTAGYSLESFQGAMQLLEDKKLIRRSGHVAYYIPKLESKHA